MADNKAVAGIPAAPEENQIAILATAEVGQILSCAIALTQKHFKTDNAAIVLKVADLVTQRYTNLEAILLAEEEDEPIETH